MCFITPTFCNLCGAPLGPRRASCGSFTPITNMHWSLATIVICSNIETLPAAPGGPSRCSSCSSPSGLSKVRKVLREALDGLLAGLKFSGDGDESGLYAGTLTKSWSYEVAERRMQRKRVLLPKIAPVEEFEMDFLWPRKRSEMVRRFAK